MTPSCKKLKIDSKQNKLLLLFIVNNIYHLRYLYLIVFIYI